MTTNKLLIRFGIAIGVIASLHVVPVNAETSQPRSGKSAFLPIVAGSTAPVQITVPDEQLTKWQKEKQAAVPISLARLDAQSKYISGKMEQLSALGIDSLQRASPSATLDDLLEIASSPAYAELNQHLTTSALKRAEGGVGDGTNSVDTNQARTGDILFGHNGALGLGTLPGYWGWWTHTAIWSPDGLSNNVLEANFDSRNANYTWFDGSVRRRRNNHFNANFDEGAIMGVWVASDSARNTANSFATSQIGKPYTIWTAKTDYNYWYCSKLVWAAYWQSWIDLDSTARWMVLPDAIYNSVWTYTRSVSW